MCWSEYAVGGVRGVNSASCASLANGSSSSSSSESAPKYLLTLLASGALHVWHYPGTPGGRSQVGDFRVSPDSPAAAYIGLGHTANGAFLLCARVRPECVSDLDDVRPASRGVDLVHWPVAGSVAALSDMLGRNGQATVHDIAACAYTKYTKATRLT